MGVQNVVHTDDGAVGDNDRVVSTITYQIARRQLCRLWLDLLNAAASRVEGYMDNIYSLADTDSQRLRDVAVVFDPHVEKTVHDIVGVLDELATTLARNQGYRRHLGNAGNPSLWPILRSLWVTTAEAHTGACGVSEPLLIALCVSLARFTRNLVASEPLNQERAYENEPAIRTLIYHYTSFSALQETKTFPVTRILVQTVSNIVTANDALSEKLWTTYVNLPEERLILIRLFASPDPCTVSSSFVFVLNCVHDSRHRIELLTTTIGGARMCISLLDRLAALFDAEESSDESRAFDIGYGILRQLIEEGLIARLYTRLSMEEEAITPHQTTLLKLLDSYLQSSACAHDFPSARRRTEDGDELLRMLSHTFLALSSYVQGSIERSLGPRTANSGDTTKLHVADQEAGSPRAESDAIGHAAPSSGSDSSPLAPQELDLLLPKVCEALVLVTQCLTSITLRAEEAECTYTRSAGPEAQLGAPLSPKQVLATAVTSDGRGLVEILTETLRLLDVFLPRITFGQVVQRGSDSVPTTSQNQQPISGVDTGDTSRQAMSGIIGFSYVKRDLVRLLGILSAHNRTVQDRVRVCGGIPVIMNLCVVDDQNPYLREHAIFALKNVLHGNRENQAVVDAIKPIGRWDENRVLQDIRGEHR